jgi:lipid-A-disaccharide synthase
MLRVAIVAGEPSGDLLAAGLIRELRQRVDALEVIGIAGPAMQAAGCVAWESIERLAVMGVPEIIRRYPALKALQRRTIDHVRAVRPDVFVGVDAPEFNLGIEIALRAAGIRTVHYVSPSVWAWRESRLQAIERGVDLMLVLFPFEETYYQEQMVPVAYVGHPLAGALAAGPTRESARAALGWDTREPVLAVLPGSRVSELKHHAQPFLKAALQCAKNVPGLRVAIPLVDDQAARWMRHAVTRHAPGLPATCHVGRTSEVLAAADVGLIASGTATLEALLLDCPMVVAYRVHWLSYALIRPLVRISRFSLPNLLAAADIVPEYIQGAATPANLASHLQELLNDAEARARQLEHFAAIRTTLAQDASAKAAEAVLALVSRGERK